MSLSTNITVVGTLLFTSGKITTGANTVTIGTTATTGVVTPTGGYVVGNVKKFVNNNAAQSTHVYEVGTALYYTPLTITPLANFQGRSASDYRFVDRG